jgi:hypothetical protein
MFQCQRCAHTCCRQVTAPGKKTDSPVRPAAAAASQAAKAKPAPKPVPAAPAADLLGLDNWQGDAVGSPAGPVVGDDWSAFGSFGGLAAARPAGTTTAAPHPKGSKSGQLRGAMGGTMQCKEWPY